MEQAAAAPSTARATTERSKRRALIELGIAYGLILAVIWSARPLQRYLWILAVAALVIMFWRSWDGPEVIGLRRESFLRSIWIVFLALGLAAIAVIAAIDLHTLGLPVPPPTGPASSDSFSAHALLFLKTYWGYAVWTFVQQLLLQGFFLLRLLRILPGPKSAAFAAASLFALAHVPSPILSIATLVWGFAACLLFLRYRNLYSLGIAHAIFGITIAITVPGPVIRNMRVGLGYLTYRHHSHGVAQSLQPQRPDRVH